MNKKTSGVRWLVINGLERDQLINFISRRDANFKKKNLEKFSGKELRNMALDADQKVLARRREALMKRKGGPT